jgi:hypothetical protein
VESWTCKTIATGFPRQAALVAAGQNGCNDQMYGGLPGTCAGAATPS